MDIVGISTQEQVAQSYMFFDMIGSCLYWFFFRTCLHLICLQDAIFRVVAAILHIGNIEFAKGKEVDSSVLKDDKSKFHLDTTAELLM